MTLRTKLALAFALFAAVPLGLALVPVSRALRGALAAEQAARLESAAAALEGELARLGEAAVSAARELAAGPEVEALAADRAAELADPAELATRGAEWMGARGLDVLAVLDAEGRVVTSGHLAGRAGDLDPELAPPEDAPARRGAADAPARAVARIVSRAGPGGVEPTLALVAFAAAPSGSGRPAPGAGLTVVGGLALGPERAARLASLTGGEIAIRAGGVAGALLAEAAAPGRPAPSGFTARLARLSGLGDVSRQVAVGPPGAPVARLEVTLASDGLARAQATVLLAFLAALALGTLAAAAAGAALAARIVSPLEALREAAARVAAGDLEARVTVDARGEVGELVEAWNAMTLDLAQGRARLAQAERVAAWREVARRLAHEIKNPLAPIAMSISTLQDARRSRRPDFDEVFDESTTAIGEEVRRLKRIVDEFSRFARLPAPERSAVAPEELVGAVRALFPATPAGVTIVEAVEPGLPEVLADRDQVLQVLLNLVRNALDVMLSGGRLGLAARRDGDAVRFEVTDTGPGVPAAQRERIFEPYVTTKESGTGLGLAIARRIAEEHGGALSVEEAPGGGARFVLRLPLARRAAAVIGPASP